MWWVITSYFPDRPPTPAPPTSQRDIYAGKGRRRRAENNEWMHEINVEIKKSVCISWLYKKKQKETKYVLMKYSKRAKPAFQASNISV